MKRFMKISSDRVALPRVRCSPWGSRLTIGWRPFIGPRVRPLTSRVFERTPERLARGKYLVRRRQRAAWIATRRMIGPSTMRRSPPAWKARARILTCRAMRCWWRRSATARTSTRALRQRCSAFLR